MKALLRGFLREDRLLEYGLLCSLVASVVLASLLLDPIGLRSSLVSAYQKAVEALYLAAQGNIGKL